LPGFLLGEIKAGLDPTLQALAKAAIECEAVATVLDSAPHEAPAGLIAAFGSSYRSSNNLILLRFSHYQFQQCLLAIGLTR
jgi:hypothetical protein